MNATLSTRFDACVDAMPDDTAMLVAALLAIDPHGLGGVVLNHPVHEQSRSFVNQLQRLLPLGAPIRRLPVGVTADRLLGGVDLAATLSAGRLVSERGVLAAADGGVVVVPMAERASLAVRTTLSAVLDTSTVMVACDGVTARHDARVLAVLLDESVEDETIHPALIDRVAFRVHVRNADDHADVETVARLTRRVDAARHALPHTVADDTWVQALCETAEAFGVFSLRAPLFALRCARAHAAFSGRASVIEEDAAVAARLVLAPRATRVPSTLETAPPDNAEGGDDNDESEPPPPPESQSAAPDARPPDKGSSDVEADDRSEAPLPSEADVLRDAVIAALPPGLLAQLLAKANGGAVQGRVGAETQSLLRGRPRGARAGLPRGGARLHLLETLRAAAPWQRARAREVSPMPTRTMRVVIRREDFRIRRFVERTGTTVIFLVDASGSAALQRLAEAKGAIEVLLAESYARRDRVCLMAFRGKGVEVLLPPTRALARAKKVLASMPGGGGTPIATAIDKATEQALAIRREGSAPLVVMLSDGRGNIARDGTPGRPGAERDALAAAATFAQFGFSALFVDTSPRGEVVARRIADAMHARYVYLPFADARALGGLVRTAMHAGDTADTVR